MSWQRQVIATPAGLGDALGALEPPTTKGELAQFEAAVAAVPACTETVSKREPVLVSLSGHTDPNSESFDARNFSISVSRIEPEAAHKRSEQAAAELKQAEEAKAAAEAQADRARAAKSRADAEAGDAAAGQAEAEAAKAAEVG